MIVRHAHRLHEGIDDGGADEVEAFSLERFRDPARDLVFRRHVLAGFRVGLDRASVDEIPQEARESAALLDDEPGARAGNGRLDLGAVAHDAGVEHQRLDLRLVEAGDHRRIEAREGLTEVLALAQDGDPGQARLEAVENEFFEQRPVVEFRHAPFRVVVRDIEGIGAGPPAAGLMVGMEDQSVGHGTV